MTQLIAHDSIATWLERRVSQHAPACPGTVSLMGVVVIDPLFVDSDTAARATWIGDETTVEDAVREWKREFHRFDAIAAVVWRHDRPDVTIVIVNP